MLIRSLSRLSLGSVALIGIFLATWAIGIGIGAAVDHPFYFAFISFPLAALLTLLFFTRQAGTAAYAAIDGQIGAGASVLMAIRKGWTTTPRLLWLVIKTWCIEASVAPESLTGEGSQSVRQMIADEKKKAERFAPGVPVIEILVGKEDGRIPIQKLQRHMRRLPKKLSAHQMREVRARLKAVGGMSMPIPKGPMPTRAPKIR